MYQFFISIHGRPQGIAVGPDVELLGQAFGTLQIDRDALAATTIDCTFEVAREKLSALPRMYCEPDGSLVWVSPQDAPAWQVDGNLYDRHEQLLFVDLKGTCPPGQFDELLAALGWPEARLMFQLTREAVFLDEAEFRRHASISS